MFALVSPEKIQLPPGSVVRLPATWQEYQSLCDRRSDRYPDDDSCHDQSLATQGNQHHHYQHEQR